MTENACRNTIRIGRQNSMQARSRKQRKVGRICGDRQQSRIDIKAGQTGDTERVPVSGTCSPGRQVDL